MRIITETEVVEDLGDVEVVVPNGYDEDDPCSWWILKIEFEQELDNHPEIYGRQRTLLQRKINFCQRQYIQKELNDERKKVVL